MVEREEPVVWDILADVIREHPILLNRAPTLHRLGIQAFEPTLIEGKAIQLHPLVCKAYKQTLMAIKWLFMSSYFRSSTECRALMMASNNILSPSNGKPIIDPSQDVVLGIYYMTREKVSAKGEGSIFADINEVHRAYESGNIDLQAKVKVRLANKESELNLVDTTVGRAILSGILPKELDFELINQPLDSKAISSLINMAYRHSGLKETVIFADKLMYLGYEYSTKSGSSICVDDCQIPTDKEEIISSAESEVKEMNLSIHLV